MYLEIEGGYRRKHWRGRIISSAGAELGQLAFELAGGRLALTAGSDELVLRAFCEAETHGSIYLNSQPYATYTVQKTGEIEVTDSDGVTVLVLLKDSFGRRRKWAYRQGAWAFAVGCGAWCRAFSLCGRIADVLVDVKVR